MQLTDLRVGAGAWLVTGLVHDSEIGPARR
jgi:hypothetical protein